MLIPGMVLALVACQPDPDIVVPTTKFAIENIPVRMYRTEKDTVKEAADLGQPVFKVFAQLSDGYTPSAKDVALWYAVASPTANEIASGKMTVTLENWDEEKDANFNGKGYKALVIIISPQEVNDIYDVDFKAFMRSPTTSSTVTLSWEGGINKHLMSLSGGEPQALENLRRLYGEVGASDGIICKWDHENNYGGQAITGAKVRAHPNVINSLSLFNKRNDKYVSPGP